MTPRVVLVTGAPGSGKSTLAHQLSQLLEQFVQGFAQQRRLGSVQTAGQLRQPVERGPTSCSCSCAPIFSSTYIAALARAIDSVVTRRRR